MIPRTLAEAAEAVAGSVRPPGTGGTVSGATVDSRLAGPGDLFFALRGERIDGHRFVGEALRRGATGAVVRRGWANGKGEEPPGPWIEVDDPAAALLRLARDARSRLDGECAALRTHRTYRFDFVRRDGQVTVSHDVKCADDDAARSLASSKRSRA